MSSPDCPSQESSSSSPFSTNGQGPERASFITSTGLVVLREEMAPPALSSLLSSSSDSTNGPVMKRYFCPMCNCTIILGPSTAWVVSCPICREPFQSEQEAQPAATFPSQSNSNATVCAAGFEKWYLSDNLFYVAWELNFFSHHFSRTSEVARVPIPSAGMLIPLPFLQRFLHGCFKSGASITISPDEAISASLTTVTYSLLANLELRDGLLYSGDIICSICLDSLSNRKKVMVTPCNHSYHENCLLPWALKEKTCPICRSKIITEAFGTEIALFTDTVEDLRQLSVSDSHQRSNPIIRKFKIVLLWPHGGTSSHTEAGSSGGGHDANHTS